VIGAIFNERFVVNDFFGDIFEHGAQTMDRGNDKHAGLN